MKTSKLAEGRETDVTQVGISFSLVSVVWEVGASFRDQSQGAGKLCSAVIGCFIMTRDQVPSTTQGNHHCVVAMARTHGKRQHRERNDDNFPIVGTVLSADHGDVHEDNRRRRFNGVFSRAFDQWQNGGLQVSVICRMRNNGTQAWRLIRLGRILVSIALRTSCYNP